MGERGSLEGDDVAFGVGEGVGGEGDEAGAGEGVEESVELFAVDAEGESSVWSLPVARGRVAVEGAEDGAEMAVLLLWWVAKGLRGGAFGGAEVAVAAGAETVGGVAEVLDEGGHAALRVSAKRGHAVDLGTAEGELGVVAGLPGLRVAPVARTLPAMSKAGGTLRDEFFGGLRRSRRPS